MEDHVWVLPEATDARGVVEHDGLAAARHVLHHGHRQPAALRHGGGARHLHAVRHRADGLQEEIAVALDDQGAALRARVLHHDRQHLLQEPASTISPEMACDALRTVVRSKLEGPVTVVLLPVTFWPVRGASARWTAAVTRCGWATRSCSALAVASQRVYS